MPFMNLISVKSPASGVAAARESLELLNAAFRIVATRDVLQIVTNHLIETLA